MQPARPGCGQSGWTAFTGRAGTGGYRGQRQMIPAVFHGLAKAPGLSVTTNPVQVCVAAHAGDEGWQENRMTMGGMVRTAGLLQEICASTMPTIYSPTRVTTRGANYHVVLSGKVRVMLNGRIMTSEEVQAIDAKNWMPDDPGYPYALPGDILLSVPDALRFWMDRPRAGAMLKKFGGESPLRSTARSARCARMLLREMVQSKSNI